MAKKEDELQRRIARGASRERLLEAANEVREGKIRVLRAKQNQNPESCPEERAIYLQDEAAISTLRELSAEAILGDWMRAVKTTTA